jgi:hypothetical protein
MNQKDAFKSLGYYLSDRKTYQVIALKGQWGGGKTYVWRQAEGSLPTDIYDEESGPLYASLFGVNSIEELKKRLYGAQLDKIIPNGTAVIDGAKGVASKVPRLLSSVSKLAEGVVNIAGAAASSLGDILVDQALKDRLIVLDDLERRGSSLSVINVLGLIDFLRTRGCQVLVIFNEEKIGDAEQQQALQTFREKAFDVEMQLDITPAEAFSIALERGPRPEHAELLGTSFEKLGVTNIRVAIRILAAAKQMFGLASNLDEELVAELLPAVAVVTSIFYEAVPGAPTLDEVDEDYQQTRGRPAAAPEPKVNELGEAISRISAFRKEHMPLVDRRFLRLFVEHIKTGNLLSDELTAFWKTASEELVARRVGSELESWVEDVEWAPIGTAEEFLARVRHHVQSAAILEPQLRRIVAQEVRKLGDDKLAAEFSDDSIAMAVKPAGQLAEFLNTGSTSDDEARSSRNAVYKLYKEIEENSFIASNSGHHFQHISSDEIERALETNNTKEFKMCVRLLMYFESNDIKFEAKNLARAISQVIARDNGKREAVIRAHLGNPALDRILAISRNEAVDGWPQVQRIPQRARKPAPPLLTAVVAQNGLSCRYIHANPATAVSESTSATPSVVP